MEDPIITQALTINANSYVAKYKILRQVVEIRGVIERVRGLTIS